MTILERELSNSDLIYIYWEQDGKWYAYEQSAFLPEPDDAESVLRVLCVMGGYFVAGKSRSGCKPDFARKYYQLQQNGICITLYPLTMDFMSGWLSKVFRSNLAFSENSFYFCKRCNA